MNFITSDCLLFWLKWKIILLYKGVIGFYKLTVFQIVKVDQIFHAWQNILFYFLLQKFREIIITIRQGFFSIVRGSYQKKKQ